jgi:hypothetical protein
VALQLGGLARGQQLLTIKKQPVMKCHTGPQKQVDFLGMMQAMENGYEIWNMEC